MSDLRDLEKRLMLLRRLEAATLLLENIVAPSHGDASESTNGSLPNEEAGLEAVGRPDLPLAAPSPQSISEPLQPAIEDFNAIITEEVQTYVNMSEEIGGLVAEQVRLSDARELPINTPTTLLTLFS